MNPEGPDTKYYRAIQRYREETPWYKHLLRGVTIPFGYDPYPPPASPYRRLYPRPLGVTVTASVRG